MNVIAVQIKFFEWFNCLCVNLKILLIVVGFAVVVVMVVLILWVKVFDYCILFSNFFDQDGGVIVS